MGPVRVRRRVRVLSGDDQRDVGRNRVSVVNEAGINTDLEQAGRDGDGTYPV